MSDGWQLAIKQKKSLYSRWQDICCDMGKALTSVQLSVCMYVCLSFCIITLENENNY